MRTLVFLLEEPSARELLKGIVPRVIPADVDVKYLTFEGKQDLEKNITKKLRAWQAPNSTFVVLRDQDSAPDCKKVKAQLEDLVRQSGKSALVRIACRTLEAWVVGDLSAVAKAFDKPTIARRANEKKYRAPDGLGNPFEELRQLIPAYQKIDGARRVGKLLNPTENNSHSFKVLWSGLSSLFPRLENEIHKEC